MHTGACSYTISSEDQLAELKLYCEAIQGILRTQLMFAEYERYRNRLLRKREAKIAKRDAALEKARAQKRKRIAALPRAAGPRVLNGRRRKPWTGRQMWRRAQADVELIEIMSPNIFSGAASGHAEREIRERVRASSIATGTRFQSCPLKGLGES